jgi:hypothetical protein
MLGEAADDLESRRCMDEKLRVVLMDAAVID